MALARHTRGVRRNLKEQQRRAQIKEAAISLFSTKGYQQSTMDDLAVEAGVSKSLIYWYWESKAALLSELIDTCMQPYIDLLAGAVASPEPFVKKFHQFLWDYLEMSRDNDRLNKLVHFCSLHHPQSRSDNFSGQVNDHYKRVMALIEELVGQAVDAGFLPPGTDCAAMALMLLSLTEGHIYMSILEERLPLERIYAGLLLPLLGWADRPGGNIQQ
ncbi:MAG: TetR/AcrR family transcriptional regulator [Desulfosudaceae bacterium]